MKKQVKSKKNIEKFREVPDNYGNLTVNTSPKVRKKSLRSIPGFLNRKPQK